jgi:hypothetical protein
MRTRFSLNIPDDGRHCSPLRRQLPADRRSTTALMRRRILEGGNDSSQEPTNPEDINRVHGEENENSPPEGEEPHLPDQEDRPNGITTFQNQGGIQGRTIDNSRSRNYGAQHSTAQATGGTFSTRSTRVSRKRNAVQDEVAERIHEYVKTTLFKRFKFVNNHYVFVKAMEIIEEVEGISPELEDKGFRSQYKSTLMDSLNSKRGTCEQAGGKIVQSKLLVLYLV